MTTTAKDRDRALAQAKPEDLPGEPYMDIEDDVVIDESGAMLSGQDSLGSKIIVIHPGSQNLRIGLASDALPKTIPMVIAKKWEFSESEEGDNEPKPKRLKLEDGSDVEPEKMFGEEVRILFSHKFRY
jgi:actin-related protein 8